MIPLPSLQSWRGEFFFRCVRLRFVVRFLQPYGKEALHREAYRIPNGTFTQISAPNDIIAL